MVALDLHIEDQKPLGYENSLSFKKIKNPEPSRLDLAFLFFFSIRKRKPCLMFYLKNALHFKSLGGSLALGKT